MPLPSAPGPRGPSPSGTTLECVYVYEYAIETIECVDDERVRVRGTSARHVSSESERLQQMGSPTLVIVLEAVSLAPRSSRADLEWNAPRVRVRVRNRTIECVDDERVRVRGTSERHATSGSGAENNDELAWEM